MLKLLELFYEMQLKIKMINITTHNTKLMYVFRNKRFKKNLKCINLSKLYNIKNIEL